uniref:Uncharacterized protein n=1 Tax=Bombyx mori TaxID=7091 RepID=A0A8R2LX93_BOMMO|nr:uncharacterized protein LOC101744868 isoform X1 [Bombyx mori]
MTINYDKSYGQLIAHGVFRRIFSVAHDSDPVVDSAKHSPPTRTSVSLTHELTDPSGYSWNSPLDYQRIDGSSTSYATDTSMALYAVPQIPSPWTLQSLALDEESLNIPVTKLI